MLTLCAQLRIEIVTKFDEDFAISQETWREFQGEKVKSEDLLALDAGPLVEAWHRYFAEHQVSEARRWYLTLYKEFMQGKSVLELGSGLGFDGIFFLQNGCAKWTFSDIVNQNLEVIKLICKYKGYQSDFVLINSDLRCFDKLNTFDVVWANASFMNMRFEGAQAECGAVLPHLKSGGRWIECVRPREHWIANGMPSFDGKGKLGQSRVEWYDETRLKRRLLPASMSTILNFNFHDYWFKWVDFELVSNETLLEAMGTSEIEIYPGLSPPILHGETHIDEKEGESYATTPGQIWEFAMSVELGSSVANLQFAGGHVQGGYWIEVEIIVTRGVIGILLVTEDFGKSVTADNLVRSGIYPETILMSVPPQSPARHLVFRNAEGGGSSEFAIKRINLIAPKRHR